MGILDFMNDNNVNWSKDESYIGRLINLYAATPAIAKAYFGLLYDEEQRPDLFLAVEMEEEAEEIKHMTAMLSETYMADREIIFVSNMVEPELMHYVIESNFPFYVKNRPQPLHMAVMKYWFNPDKYKADLIHQVKTGTVISIFKDFNPFGSELNFQTFIREGKEFIPLFSEEEMVPKSGMVEIPKDLTVMGFDWIRINSAVSGNLKEHYYILNPGTSFEVEFVA